MSFNVGTGFFTAQISLERLHNIKESALLPEMKLWEKIKEFFCSTRQSDALNCLHQLYHHESLGLSEQDILNTFVQLRGLASPGCRNRFTIDRNNNSDIYKINNEIILSVPRSMRADDIWFDCNEDNDVWSDCNDEFAPASQEWRDCSDDTYSDSLSWHDYNDEFTPELLTQESDTGYRMAASAVDVSMNAQKQLMLDEHYVDCIKFLLPIAEEFVGTIGIKKVASKVGIFKMPYLAVIGNRIHNNINSPSGDRQSLKKDIQTVLNMPSIMQLIPESIFSLPEFSFIKDSSMSTA